MFKLCGFVSDRGHAGRRWQRCGELGLQHETDDDGDCRSERETDDRPSGTEYQTARAALREANAAATATLKKCSATSPASRTPPSCRRASATPSRRSPTATRRRLHDRRGLRGHRLGDCATATAALPEQPGHLPGLGRRRCRRRSTAQLSPGIRGVARTFRSRSPRARPRRRRSRRTARRPDRTARSGSAAPRSRTAVATIASRGLRPLLRARALPGHGSRVRARSRGPRRRGARP